MSFGADESVLLVVDFQQTFLDKYEPAVAEDLLNKARWLVGVARWLNVPAIATAEEGRYPMLAPSLQQVLMDAPVFRKTTYDATRNAQIAAAIAAAGRPAVVCIGFETDVCVAQSAIGLKALHYRVAVIADAVRAPGTGHAHGLDRLRASGVTLLSLRGLFYEWMADARVERAFRNERQELHADPAIDY